MLKIVLGLLAFIALLPLGILFAFRGKNHSQFDHPRPVPKDGSDKETAQHYAIVRLVLKDRADTPKLDRKATLHHMRETMDQRGLSYEINARIVPVAVDDIEGEWVIAGNADPKRRVLYIHGGAYMVGSPQSHRLITSRMSAHTNAAVLVVDYRLMPENSRLAGVEDCQKAYCWVLENGPDGESDADALIVAGDSSGGNIALSIAAWARDAKLKSADAIVVFSPQTDLTLASPSLVANVDSDIMQGASFGPIVKAPRFVGLGFSFLMHRINPKRSIVSPLLGDLSGLPPTLVQVSGVEMFLDDANRYVNKANAQGSTAVLQVWPFAMHVWQAFQIPEADEAFEAVEMFIATQTAVETQDNVTIDGS